MVPDTEVTNFVNIVCYDIFKEISEKDDNLLEGIYSPISSIIKILKEYYKE